MFEPPSSRALLLQNDPVPKWLEAGLKTKQKKWLYARDEMFLL